MICSHPPLSSLFSCCPHRNTRFPSHTQINTDAWPCHAISCFNALNCVPSTWITLLSEPGFLSPRQAFFNPQNFPWASPFHEALVSLDPLPLWGFLYHPGNSCYETSIMLQSDWLFPVCVPDKLCASWREGKCLLISALPRPREVFHIQ